MGVSKHPLSADLPEWARVPIDRAAAGRLTLSYGQLIAQGTRAAALFWDKLVTRRPGVASMLPTDRAGAERELMAALGLVVDHIHDAAAVRDRLRALADTLRARKVMASEYKEATALLVEAMAETVGKGWTPKLSAEWTQALDLVGGLLTPPAPGSGSSTAETKRRTQTTQ